MNHIVVDDFQAELILHSAECIEVRDRSGKHLGYVAQDFSDEDLAIAKLRASSDEVRHSTNQVLSHLQSLDPK